MILTVEEAAALLKFEPATVRRVAARGEVPARKIGGAWRFSAEQLEEFIRAGWRQPAAPLEAQTADAIERFNRLGQKSER